VRCKDHHRKPINYAADAPPVNMVTDGCATGIAGVISQGGDWKTAKVAAFYSAKLTPAQQNYPVHEIEMLAGIETMLRYRDVLQGVHFRWYTDHKGLIHLLNQKNLSGRQARWIEKISMFDFEVIYVPGAENILSDALSHRYSFDAPGTVRAASEYSEHDDTAPGMSGALQAVSNPVFVGSEGVAASFAVNFVGRKSKRAAEVPAETGRPETGEEFAARVREEFVLHGPRERTEGGKEKPKTRNSRSGTELPPEIDRNERLVIRIPARNKLTTESAGSTKYSPAKPALNDTSDNEVATHGKVPPLDLAQDLSGVDITKEIKGKYLGDSVFSKVVEKPSEHKNFSIKDDLIYINDARKTAVPPIILPRKWLN